MWPAVLIIVYCLLIAAASFAGGMLPSLVRLTHTRMQVIMSFVGGLVLGVAMLHMLPHSAAETDSWDFTMLAALAGLLTMFLLIRALHVHHHGPVQETCAGRHEPAAVACEHHEHHHHDHDPTEGECCDTHRHPYSWIGLGVGLAVHTLIDGMALAASVSAEKHGTANGLALLGVGTFLAVLLHKPLDAMSITSVMATGGWSPRARQVVNLGFAMMCAIGAAGFYLGIQQLVETQRLIIGGSLGFAAGVFLCISLADILPEVHFHSHDRFKLSAALLLGVALAYGIGLLEPSHGHGHGQTPAPVHSSEGHPDAD